MLRVPLNTDAEGVCGMFDALNNAVLTCGGKNQRRCNLVNSLMMQAVGQKGFLTHDFSQLCAARDGNLVISTVFARIIIVAAGGNICDILMERTSEEDIHQLLTAADTQDGLAGGKKRFQHFHFCMIPGGYDFATLFRGGLAVKSGIYILTAGQ